MRAWLVAALLAGAGPACATKIGALHHRPFEIYDALAKSGAPAFSAAPEVHVPAGVAVVVEPFTDRSIAPTGLYLSDEESNITKTVELYYTPHIGEHLADGVAAALGAAGAKVYRSYGAPARQVAGAKRLAVWVDHAELHRWKRDAGTVDIVAVRYRYGWSAGEPAPAPDRSGELALLLRAGAEDDLDVVARHIAAEVTRSLP